MFQRYLCGERKTVALCDCYRSVDLWKGVGGILMDKLRTLLEKLKEDKIKHCLLTLILIFYASTPLLSPAVDSASFRHVGVSFILVCSVTMLYRSRIRKEYILYVMFWAEAVIATLLSPYVSVSSASVTYLLFAVMVVCFANLEFSARDLKRFVDFYICFALLCAVLIILSWLADIPHTPGTYSVGILGITKNPNYINSVIILGVTFLLYRLVTDTKGRIMRITIMAVLVFASLQTGTRAAILTIVLCAVFTVGHQLVVTKTWEKILSYVKANWKVVAVCAVAAVAVLVLTVYVLPDSAKRRFTKLFSDNIRITMWTHNMLELLKQPILGMGLNATTSFTAGLGLAVNNIHNTILQLLCEQGLIGFAIFSAIIWRNLRRVKKQDLFLILLMCVAMYFPILFQNNLTSNTFWWPLVFLEVFTRVSEREGLGVE